MKFIFFLPILIILPLTASAKPAAYLTKNNIFLEGYDPVAYLSEKKAIKGSKQFQQSYDGTIFYFSSLVNKEAFIADPLKMLPAYKGWCAYAMATNGELAKVDPKSFKVINNKTYLFYNSFWVDTLKKWNKINNDKKQIQQADQYWTSKHTK